MKNIHINITTTLIGVVIGGIVSFFSSAGLWVTQSSYENDVAIKNKREELIVETADIFSRAGRINGLIHGHILQIAASNKITNLCISMAIQGKESKACDENIDYNIMNEFNKEIFEYTAKYQKLYNLIPLYFCEKTKFKFENIESKKSWWEITPKETAEILKIMHQEYECNL